MNIKTILFLQSDLVTLVHCSYILITLELFLVILMQNKLQK